MEFLNTIFNGPAAALTSSTHQATNSPRSRDLPSRETMFRFNKLVQVDGNDVTHNRSTKVTRMSPEIIMSNNDGMAHTLIEHSGNIMHSSQNGESNIGEEILQPKSTSRNAIYGFVAAVPYDSFGKPGPSWNSAQETGVVQRGVKMALSDLLIILKMTGVPDDKDCPLVGDEEGGQMYNRTILDLFHEIKRLKAQQKNVSQLVGAVKGCTIGDIATNDAVLDALRAFDNDPLYCGDPGPCMDGCKSQSNNDITKSVTLRQDLKGSAKDLTGVATLAARFEFGITLRSGVQPMDLAKMVHAHVEDEHGPQHEVEQAKQNVDDLSLKHEDESEQQVERQLQSLIQEDQQVCKSIHATKGQRSPRVLKVSNDGRACEKGTSLQLKTIPNQQQIREFTNDQYEGEVQRDVRTRRLTPSGSIEHLRRNFEVNSNANTASFATSETAPRPLTKRSPEGTPDNFQIECMATPLTQTPMEAESVRNRLSRVEQLLKRSSEIKQAVDEGYPLYCSSGLGKVRTPTSESMLSEPDPAPASTRKVSDDTHQSADSISTPYLTSSIQQMTHLRGRHREQGNTKSNTATVYQNSRTDDQGRSNGTVPGVHNVLQPSNAISSVMKSVELLGESNSIANSPPKSTSPDKREMGPSVTDLRKHLESATNTKKQSDSKSSSVFTRNAVTIIPLKVKSIDELRAHHEQFVEQKEKASLSASPRVLRCTSTKCREVGEQRPRWSSTETRECSNFNGADVTRSTKATSSTETDQPTPRQQVAPAIASSIAQAAPAQGGRKLEETREENQIQIKAFYEKQQYGNGSTPIRTSESATQCLALPKQGSFEEGRSSIQKTITSTTRSAPRMHNDRQTSIHAAHASGAATSPRKSSGDPVQSASSYNQNDPRAQSSYNQNDPKAHSQISDNSSGGVKSQYEAFARQPCLDHAHASEAAQASSPNSVSISNISQDVSISNIEKQQYGNGSTPIRTSQIATQRLALPKQGSFEEGRSSIQKTITNTTRSAPRMHNERQTSIHAAHASGAAISPRKSSGDPVHSVSSYNQNDPRSQSSYNQNYPKAHSQISDNSSGGVKSQYEAFARQPCLDHAHASEAAPAPDVSISNKSQYQTFLKMFGSGQGTLDNWQEARAAVATIAASSRTQINLLQSTSSHVQGQSIRSASTLQNNGQERGIGTVASTGGSGYRSTTTQARPNEMGSSISYSRTHQPTYLPPQTRAQREFDRLSVNTCTSENQKRPAVSNTRTWGELVEWA